MKSVQPRSSVLYIFGVAGLGAVALATALRFFGPPSEHSAPAQRSQSSAEAISVKSDQSMGVRIVGAPPPESESQDLSSYLKNLSSSDFPAAFAGLCSGLLPAVADPDVLALLERWSRVDASGAVRAWSLLPAGATRVAALELLGRSLDPASDVELALGLPAADERHLLLSRLALRASQTAPSLAFEIAALSGETDPNDACMIAVTRGLLERSPEEAARLLVAQSATTYRNFLRGDIALAWARTDPAAALDFARVYLQNNDTRELVLTRLLQGWAKADAGALHRWMATLPADATRDEFIRLLEPFPT